MAASTHPVKRKIISALHKLGDAGPSAIASELGPEWLTSNKYVRLRQILKEMALAHLVIHVQRGVYRLSPSCTWRGLDVRDATEAAIARFLRSRGGLARTAEIHEALTDRRLHGSERDYDHRRVTQALAQSARFQQDFGRGRWNLTPAELEEVPLLGRVADYQHQVAWVEDKGGFETWEAKRDHFFDFVGSAFMDARGDREIAEVAAWADVSYALADMAQAAPSARREALDVLSAQVREDMRSDGVTDAWAIAQEIQFRKEDGLAVYLYRLFEHGNPELHMAAPVEFYRACALLFDVCPVQLSRGEIAPSAAIAA